MARARRNVSYGGRAAAPDLSKATAVWKLFHKKPEPHELIEMTVSWPAAWEYAGEAVTTYYRSDKWEDDGNYFRYYHDHNRGKIGIWHPAGMLPWASQSPAAPRFTEPGSVAVLGYSMGVDVKRHDTGKEQRMFTERGAYLVSSPNRKHLWIVEPTNGIVAMIAGPGLVVNPEGICG